MKGANHCISFIVCCFLLLGASASLFAQETVEERRERNWYQRALKMFDPYLEAQQPTVVPIQKDQQRQDMLTRYQSIYAFLNGTQNEQYDSLAQAGLLIWDDARDSVFINYPKTTSQRDSNYQVFGWHPYWMGEAYQNYRFQLLSTLAYYAYDLDPTNGSYNNPTVIDEWKQTDLVDLAHADACAVQLTLTCHQTEDIRLFLDNQFGQQKALMDSLVALLQIKNADGINVNFELTPKGYGAKFTRFIRTLSNRLKWENGNYQLTLTLPSTDRNAFFQVDQLVPWVDFFVLMAYDYHNPDTQAGAIAPMRSGKRNIEKSVDRYLGNTAKSGKGIPESQLILGLPYYGGIWEISKNGKDTFEQHLTFRAIRNSFEKPDIQYDFKAWSPYFRSTENGITYECWYEDSISLSRKYEWAKAQNLAGIGIWALGYDSGYPELWNAIENNFALKDSLVHLPATANGPTAFFQLADTLSDYHQVAILAGIFLFVFIMLGFLLALFNWKVRAVFFSNYTYRLIYIIGIFIGFIVLILLYGPWENTWMLNNPITLIALALLLGSGLTSMVGHWYQTYRKRLP